MRHTVVTEYNTTCKPHELLRWLLFLTYMLTLMPLSLDIQGFVLYSQDVALFPLIYFALIGVFARKDKMIMPWSDTEKLFTLIVLFMTLGTLLSSHIVNSIDVTLVWCRTVIFYLMVRWFLYEGVIGIGNIEAWWQFFLVAELVIGLGQITSGTNIGVPSNYFGEPLLDPELVNGPFRISGTTSNSNVFGQWVTIFALWVNARLIFSERKRFYFVIALFVIEVFVLMATYSRGCLAFFLLGNLIVLFFWCASIVSAVQKRHLVILTLSLAIIGIVGCVAGFDRLSVLGERIRENADYRREGMLVAGLKLLQFPKVLMFGTGMGAYNAGLIEYGIGTDSISTWKDLSDSKSGIHNIFALFFAEGGIFVGLFFVTLYLRSVCRAFRMAVQRHWGQDYRGTAVFVLAALISLIIPLMVYNSTISPSLLIFFITLIALVDRLYEINELKCPLQADQEEGSCQVDWDNLKVTEGINRLSEHNKQG